ncbi:MAG: choice-of-anchor D domain-containing protein, partial [Polyangia bacterium]|nr:choice-of-anchor D domain-containing protein [Polyangia bacterium]
MKAEYPRSSFAHLFTCVALGASALLVAACGGKPSGANNNNQTYCESVDECPAGMDCVGNICVWPSDSSVPDADVRVPDIALSTQHLDFQSPLLGTEVVLPLSIFNLGQSDLVITQIVVDEPGGLQEFHVSQEGTVQITIAPGAEHVLQVSLISVDAELDTGSIRFFSNDPDENPVIETLTSEYKGTADVMASVFTGDATPPYPDQNYPDCQVDAQERPLIDFGLVRFGEPQERNFVLWNVAVGNAPLTIQSIAVTNTSGAANTYRIFAFTQDPLNGDATALASLPFYLSAGDPPNAVPPDLLYVKVEFDASVDVFPQEQLEIQTNDPESGQLFVSIIGVVSGCPDGWWDVNQNPADGCEYACVFQSTLEQCTASGDTPVDENCDGMVDDEDAIGCSVFYRDHDLDTYGAIGDYRCLCAPEGEYTATVGLDCNDNDAAVKPGVQERCITPYDDNCDGSDNDVNAQGCVNYLRDEDGDSYGRTGDTRCLCYASGFYGTTTGGDCDDDPSACGASCNPGKTENCSTVYDDNCNGDNNELNALGCTNFYRDFDMDGYGHQTDYQCWCYPRGLYTAAQPTDCNDNADAINPGATEVCDYVDNNCVNGIDEGFNLQTNVSHCGSCNHACTNAHGTTACVSGQCSPTCADGWGNCDNNKDNGCETDLNTAIFCGICTNHNDCPTNFFCNIGTCTKKYTNGQTCTNDVMCQMNFCRDGYCCNSNCGGTLPDCQACN